MLVIFTLCSSHLPPLLVEHGGIYKQIQALCLFIEETWAATTFFKITGGLKFRILKISRDIWNVILVTPVIASPTVTESQGWSRLFGYLYIVFWLLRPPEIQTTSQANVNNTVTHCQCLFYFRQKKLPRHSHDTMAPHTLAGTLFTVQTVTGILANFSLLRHYVTLCVTGFRFKSTDVIVQHLAVANCLIMFSKGIPQTMTALGVKHFLHEFGCLSVLYIYRVARGVSITATCILSVFQAITMSSINSSCKKLKKKVSPYVGVSIFLCWILYMCVNLIFPLYSHSKWNFKNITWNRDSEYCSAGLQNGITNSLYIVLVLLPEVSCSGLMLWSSSTMICILHRHRKKMQHIHKTRLSSRPSPETRATQSILALVFTFVFFYTLSSTFYAYIATFNISSKWLTNTSALISTCFPTISPFVLMNRDCTVTRLWTKFRASVRFMSHLYFFTNFRFIQRPICNSIRKTQAS